MSENLLTTSSLPKTYNILSFTRTRPAAQAIWVSPYVWQEPKYLSSHLLPAKNKQEAGEAEYLGPRHSEMG